MRKKEWIFVAVWFVTFIAALNFYRFQFGIFTIAGVWLLVGVPIAFLLKRRKPN